MGMKAGGTYVIEQCFALLVDDVQHEALCDFFLCVGSDSFLTNLLRDFFPG